MRHCYSSQQLTYYSWYTTVDILSLIQLTSNPWAVYCEGPPSLIWRGRGEPKMRHCFPVYSWHTLSKCAQNTQKTVRASTLCIYILNNFENFECSEIKIIMVLTVNYIGGVKISVPNSYCHSCDPHSNEISKLQLYNIQLIFQTSFNVSVAGRYCLEVQDYIGCMTIRMGCIHILVGDLRMGVNTE